MDGQVFSQLGLHPTVSHLSRISPTRWSIFWVSAGSWALSLMALPDLTYLFGAFAGLVEVSAAVQGPLHQLVPAGLDTEQQVLDENHVLLHAGEAELRAGLLQSQDLLSRDVQYLVLIDLEEDCVQDEAGGLGHVEGLFSLGQPVDGVLQRGLETCRQGNSLIQLRLKTWPGSAGSGWCRVRPPLPPEPAAWTLPGPAGCGTGRPPVGLAADSWLSVLLSHCRNSSNSPWKPSAYREKGELNLCLLPYLVQGGLQQLLPLLGLQQEALPALVQMVQLVPQLAGLVQETTPAAQRQHRSHSPQWHDGKEHHYAEPGTERREREETYVVFSQLDFNGLGVRADGPLCVQGGVCVVQPGLQLRQSVLELTQGQQGTLDLVFPEVTELGQWLLDHVPVRLVGHLLQQQLSLVAQLLHVNLLLLFNLLFDSSKISSHCGHVTQLDHSVIQVVKHRLENKTETISKDEVGSEGPDKLQLLPQAVGLCLNSLVEGEKDMVLSHSNPSLWPPYLSSLDLLFDERGVHAGVLQLPHDVLGVSERAQQRRHVGPELTGQVIHVVQLPLLLLRPLPDLIPQGAQAQEAGTDGWGGKGEESEITQTGGEKLVGSHWAFNLVIFSVMHILLTLSGRVVVSSPSDELLSAGAQSREAGQQFVQLQPLGSVLPQLLPDLVHLGCHRGGLPQPLHRPLQGLQQGVHLVVKLGAEGELDKSVIKRK
ncbi:hypothetical protein F7725_025437 [Dissostichus mawsoni]|uniref:Uncharacterized protein n=1 Tax=Dissostichus mawsoni TaxID=36200 RepID=A0A7J5XBL1_DISMA|nr:hypothetical protein F7725_025437 [Dissostichus mawsoni]